MTDLFSKIKEVTELHGIAGFEHDVRNYLRQKMTPLVDRVETDGLGGIFGIKDSKTADAPRIMVAAHMDEVGFMISDIKPDGTFRVVEIGGWSPLVVSAQRFTLHTQTGAKLPVISGSVPPHLMRGNGGATIPKVADVIFDAGFVDKAEAESFGVRPGDIIIPESETILTANKKNIISKAWDNRYGVLMVTELLEHLKGQELPNTLIAGANVQEEVGLRGAKVAANKIKPDLAIAVDVAVAYDTPGMSGQVSDTAIGNGPVVILMDGSNIGHVGFMKHIKAVAKKHNITIQLDTTAGGGTDAGSIHVANEGTPTVAIGVALRYMHSNVSVLHTDDYKNSVALVTEIIKSLNDDVVDQIIW